MTAPFGAESMPGPQPHDPVRISEGTRRLIAAIRAHPPGKLQLRPLGPDRHPSQWRPPMTTLPPDDDDLRTATLDALTAAGVHPSDCDANRLEDLRDQILVALREAAAYKRALTLTPLGYAGQILGRAVGEHDPGFVDGWIVGIEGAAGIDDHHCPVDAGHYDERTSGWLAGVLAGRYAVQYGWVSATQRSFDG